MESENEKMRKKILSIYLANITISHAELGRMANVSRATARNAVLKFVETGTLKRKAGSGRKVGFKNPKLVRKVVAFWKRRPNFSERDMAKKFNISKTLAHRIKQKEHLFSFKVQKVPNRSYLKNKIAKTRARRLYEQFLCGH